VECDGTANDEVPVLLMLNLNVERPDDLFDPRLDLRDIACILLLQKP
jgi:hypothetical protein